MSFGKTSGLFGEEVENTTMYIQRCNGTGGLHNVQRLFSLGSVQVHGTLFKPDKNSFLTFGCQDGLPVFGRIIKNLVYS